MKFSTLLAITGAALVSAADDNNDPIAFPTSVDANSLVSAVYSPSPIPTEVSPYITPLASTWYQLESSFVHDDRFPSLTSDIVSAITHAPDAVSVLQAMMTGGAEWNWKDVVTQSWYDKNVPKDSKEFVSGYLEAWDKAADEVVKKSGAAAPRGVGAGVAVAVAAGVIAAML
ncbi:hypothetical protein QBC40DRAFT_271135 [Triangularia verruculosa]|uniref:Uncharacterized protein n=1 Tax=Triangularia verruculosa TaxID=2587418 RepID=A0AAN7B0A2_9PEZI|nr:hypothetical protein QBC40DRAFT_271135 [Triangularia verruculosa]